MSETGGPLLQITGLVKSFNGQTVLNGIDLDVMKGETICILGPSGSGKSTLLRCINWLEVPDRGTIRLQNIPIGVRANGKPMSDAELSALRARMSMVFQSFALWPHMTVLQNVMASPIHVQHRPKQFVREEAITLLEKVGLIDKLNAYPSKLSGGQKQRVGIARALAMKPDIMLFDEPTSALDPELVGEVLRVMQGLALEGLTMIVVTHEMAFARDVANRVVLLDGGGVIETGPPEQFFLNPRTERTQQFLSRYMTQTGR